MTLRVAILAYFKSLFNACYFMVEHKYLPTPTNIVKLIVVFFVFLFFSLTKNGRSIAKYSNSR